VKLTVASVLVKATGLGHVGLAVATSLVALFGAGALFAVLRARIGGVHGRALAVSVGKIAMASAAMGAVCAWSSHAVHAWLGASRTADVADAALSIPLGFAVFCGACALLRLSEVRDAYSAACYTFLSNASRSEVGGPVAGS
jgi:putative peptidoglycan lipid II flippase